MQNIIQYVEQKIGGTEQVNWSSPYQSFVPKFSEFVSSLMDLRREHCPKIADTPCFQFNMMLILHLKEKFYILNW